LDDEKLVITVSDNGRGFDPNRVGGEGNGLSNMKRRLEDIGGRIEFASQPGKGTVVRFVIQRERLHGHVMGANGQS
jgi:two-component system NarL family sensor kinase